MGGVIGIWFDDVLLNRSFEIGIQQANLLFTAAFRKQGAGGGPSHAMEQMPSQSKWCSDHGIPGQGECGDTQLLALYRPQNQSGITDVFVIKIFAQ